MTNKQIDLAGLGDLLGQNKKTLTMRYLTSILSLFFIHTHAQQTDTLSVKKKQKVTHYKKRVLDATELDILGSYYTQEGNNASVTGGIGRESLNNFATNISIAIPVNADDVFRFDGTISYYTSASSGNLNPFDTGASGNGDDDDDDDDRPSGINDNQTSMKGSPWITSSGASNKDVWVNGNLSYEHSSDDRNTVSSGHISISREYDYNSFGFGGSILKLFNQKNTQFSLSGSIFLDKWNPRYPTEIHVYQKTNGNLNRDFFRNANILDQFGQVTDKLGPNTWQPKTTELVDNNARNTYSASITFSQILSKKLQVSLFGDIVLQNGWLSNPMQRVYFKDRPNYYIGEASDIPFYTNPKKNNGVFQLADDIERLPNSRLKTPIGIRANYYINEYLVLRSYYRYYFDDWNIQSHTVNLELPIKISEKFTLYPSYRYYNQTAAKYFYPYETALSTFQYYTSDYDLSPFSANQYGFGIKYTDIFLDTKIFGIFGLKKLSLNYNYYKRNNQFYAHIVTFGSTFILQ